MKKIGLLCLFSMGLLLSVTAQITITNALFPAVGDTLFFAFDNQPQGIVMTPPGGPQQWDFSNLQASATWQQIFLNPQAGEDAASFPTAALLYKSPDGHVDTYQSVSASQVATLGISGPDPLLLGIDLVAHFNPPFVQSRAPVNFFDINQTSSGLLVPFLPGLLPGVGLLPVTPDSLRIRVAISRLDVVDAFGTLAIPGGTFDVLRQKSTEYRERRLDGKIPPLGWLDITDIGNQYLGLGLGVDTIVTYQFLSNQSKEPIAVCTTDNTQLRVVSVQYKMVDIPAVGCTDPNAHNYNPVATQNDSACQTCADGIQNGDETGIDCGGVLCGPCGCANDTEDPIIGCPGDIVVNHDPGQCGAAVNYTVNFADNCPGATLVVNPPSGSFFGIGTNAVHATVTDASGKTADCTFNVTVNDTDSDGDGTADCNDNCPGDPNKVEPGTCGCGVADTDSDGDGTADCNDNCPFDPDNDLDADGICGGADNCPADANPDQYDLDLDGIGDACDEVQNTDGVVENVGTTIVDLNLNNGQTNSLLSILDNVASSCTNGNPTAAANQLQAFINQVAAQSGKQIPEEVADQLINDAETLMAAINNNESDCVAGTFATYPGGQQILPGNPASGQVRVYPNPSHDLFRLQGLQERTQVRVLDALGNTLLMTPLSDNDALDLSGYSPGVYFIAIDTPNGRILRRVIKQ